MATGRDISDLGFNSDIVYVTRDALTYPTWREESGDSHYVSATDLRHAPTGGPDELTLYVSRSAEWSSTGNDLLYESNYESLKRDFGAERFIDISHTYGNVLALDVTRRHEDESVRELLDILIRLDDEYPLYDEEDHSRREWESLEETLESALYVAMVREGVPDEDETRVRQYVYDSVRELGQWCRGDDVDDDEVRAMVREALEEGRK